MAITIPLRPSSDHAGGGGQARPARPGGTFVRAAKGNLHADVVRTGSWGPWGPCPSTLVAPGGVGLYWARRLCDGRAQDGRRDWNLPGRS